MERIEIVQSAIQRIYEAALSPEHWVGAVASMAMALDSTRGMLLATQPDAPILSAYSGIEKVHAHGLQREFETRLPEWIRTMPVGVPTKQSSRISDREFRRTTLYNEVVRKEGGFYAVILPIASSDENQTYFVAARSLGVADYRDDDVSAAAMLAPHLAAALNVRRRLAAAELLAEAAFDALARLQVGTVLLDSKARPLYLNPYADSVIRAQDGLVVSHRELSAQSLTDAARLRKTIHLAIDASSATGSTGTTKSRSIVLPSSTLECYVSRRAPRLPLLLRVVPVFPHDRTDGVCAPASAIVFIFEPERPIEVDQHSIARTFALTPREAELVAQLARGNDLAAAAQKMRIRNETARGYLKEAQGKTGTHRQSELVALVLRSGLHMVR